jgi:MFS transporter, MHS family, citrate/tricarballylate:H+ symporter
MLLMGYGILLLALTPGYATIGIAAPVIAVIARLMQGFALGGEVGSATSYMMESATDSSRGLAMAWQGASQAIAQVLGSLVGLGLSLVMTGTQLDSYGWRIALLLGASIVPLALYMRRSLPETHDVAKVEAKTAVPFRSYRRTVALGLLLITSATISSYLFIYMATFGQSTLGLSSSVSFAGSLANSAMIFVTALLGGWLSDRFGRKPVMIYPTVLFALFIVPCFWWLNTARTPFAFIAVNLILAGTSKGPGGALYAAIGEGLPQAVRARAFALVYSVPVAVFGGTTQMVLTWLLHVTGNPMSIAWYMTAITLLGLVAMLMLRESAPVRTGQSNLAYAV